MWMSLKSLSCVHNRILLYHSESGITYVSSILGVFCMILSFTALMLSLRNIRISALESTLPVGMGIPNESRERPRESIECPKVSMNLPIESLIGIPRVSLMSFAESTGGAYAGAGAVPDVSETMDTVSELSATKPTVSELSATAEVSVAGLKDTESLAVPKYSRRKFSLASMPVMFAATAITAATAMVMNTFSVFIVTGKYSNYYGLKHFYPHPVHFGDGFFMAFFVYVC